jgi:Fe-S-cluster containining protein
MMRYGVVHDNTKMSKAREKLRDLYKKMPSTKGCLENNSKPESEGGCGSWCCEQQSPSVWYVEFLNAWNNITQNWTDEQVVGLIERSLRNYLFPNKTRGCVFWDKESKLCQHHNVRPYNCRIYGIEPEEEFNDRLVRLKVIYPNAKNQCNLVSTENGQPVTSKHIKQWWASLKGIEVSIGVPLESLHDNMEGSYRHYHDHILLHMFDDDLMEKLSILRVEGDPMQKEMCIRSVLDGLVEFSKKYGKGQDSL